jgi:myo-inositol-1(or 4)-monophosphatase
MLGSAAIDLAWVAEGRLDAAIQLSNHPWDNAAGIVLVREAGGIVLGQRGEDHTAQSTATIAVAPPLRGQLRVMLHHVFSDIPA